MLLVQALPDLNGMAKVARGIRLGQEVVSLPGAISGILIHVVLALLPSLGGLHTFLQPPVVGTHVDHRSTPTQQ